MQQISLTKVPQASPAKSMWNPKANSAFPAVLTATTPVVIHISALGSPRARMQLVRVYPRALNTLLTSWMIRYSCARA